MTCIRNGMSHLAPYGVAAALLALSIPSLHAQTVGGGLEILHNHLGLSAQDSLGRAADGIGDVNQDGFVDHAIGTPGFGNGGFAALGKVDVFSGATGALLYSLDDGSEATFGISALLPFFKLPANIFHRLPDAATHILHYVLE